MDNWAKEQQGGGRQFVPGVFCDIKDLLYSKTDWERETVKTLYVSEDVYVSRSVSTYLSTYSKKPISSPYEKYLIRS